MLAHEDLRVRRETVRALTKIGGRSAEGTLLAILQSEDQETRRQAILSLGALKCTAALPALLELATRRDGKGRLLDEKKEAVNALGQIGSSEALPQLKTILKRRRFWFGSRDDELRAAAALALGKIGSPDALALLHQATEDRSEQVARASRLALNRIEKTSSYAS
jgi:HEAT repeat protein